MTFLTIGLLIASFGFAVVGNRLIGNGDIMPWIPARRAIVYLINGSFSAAIAFTLGHALTLSVAIGAAAAIGYAVFRQPGPDIAFTSGNGRVRQILPDPKWILWLLKHIHGIDSSVFLSGTSKDIVKASLIAGAYRGLLLFPMAIAMSFLAFKFAFVLGLLGLLFGVTYWFTGVGGPWGKEEGMIMRAELIMGGLMIWVNMILPMILGVIL